MHKYLLLLFILLLPLHYAFSQDKKPKVALVLSGGGAKGIAHIPTLQALDSLGIVPDLIIGNSMGSIVGGLYAVGYSGNDIAAIVKTADWDNLIGGSMSLDNLSNEEKSEFGQYLLDMDLINKKLKINSFLLNDQYLRTFIFSETFPVHNITSFDSLPTPFRAIATDIGAGKEVILDSGSLATAMRASMSIPGVFSAIPYQNTLLIDGGLLNNFPVDVAKSMGFDFIIGSDVENGMLEVDQLDNLQALLFQAGMMTSNLKNSKNRELCDILINNGPNITYSPSDFDKAPNIYNQGKIALKNAMPALIAFSEKVKIYKQRTRHVPITKDSLTIDQVVFSGISENNLDLIKARSGLLKKKTFTKDEIIQGINTTMGTALFSQIDFGFDNTEEGSILFINAKERSKHGLKMALHYDSDQDAGLILNYTGRNILGNASRTLMTVDLAKNLKIRLQHQNILGEEKNWWVRTEAFGGSFRQGLFLSGFEIDEVKYHFYDFSSQLNRNINPLKSYVGIGIAYENSNLKPTVPPEVVTDDLSLTKYRFQSLLVNANYTYNSYDQHYFPTKGANLQLTYKTSIYNNLHIKTTASETLTLPTELNNYHKLIFDASKRIPISRKSTAFAGITTAFIFEDDLEADEYSYLDYGVGIQYFLGGNTPLARSDSFKMPGLKEGEVFASQFIKMNFGLQYALQPKLFLTPHLDVVVFGTESFSDYIKSIGKATSNWSETSSTGFIISSGVTASYNSLLGPINMDVSFVNGVNKFRFFIGIGYSFVAL